MRARYIDFNKYAYHNNCLYGVVGYHAGLISHDSSVNRRDVPEILRSPVRSWMEAILFFFFALIARLLAVQLSSSVFLSILTTCIYKNIGMN